MTSSLDVDVAVVPAPARRWPPTVCIVVDALRAGATITTLLDLGCRELILTTGRGDARRLARERGGVLVGEREGIMPRGFDYNNSPTQLIDGDVHGRTVVFCSTNGTVVVSGLRRMRAVFVGCLLNAQACAEAALAEAHALGTSVGIVCAGRSGVFALDDVLAAGVIVERLVTAADAHGIICGLTDAAQSAVALRAAYPDAAVALRASASGRSLRDLGAGADVEFCSRVDGTDTVG
ncbi:MAG TPA: 2-phosphosulfolactate phosphatase, partial [Candidatus Dormibacteraeota bacterium]